jgi:3-deoxy-manno-octulosonate cytidylyltransferase (CMP-KDO synthetase)
MKIFGIIPARYASTRFPGKPLIDISGKSMIQRVYEQTIQAVGLSEVAVATDDERIFNHVIEFGGRAVMTSSNHASGTDRCFEASQKLGALNSDIVVNIQGDEPFISPLQIEKLIACFKETAVDIATLVKRITHQNELENSSTPKVIFDQYQHAIYFSRSIIPFVRGKEISSWLETTDFYKHIGIYGYTFKALSKITLLPQSKLEVSESLEQLRWIENGFKIKVAITDIESIAIDSPEDLLKLL